MKNAIIVVLLIIIGIMVYDEYLEEEDDAVYVSTPVAIEEEQDPQVSILDKIDLVWGEGFVQSQTVLVFKNENKYPVHVSDFKATFNSVQGRTEYAEHFNIVPDLLQPGEVGYAVLDRIPSYIDYAEDFTGTEITQVVKKEESSGTYTKLQLSNVGFEYDPSDSELLVRGTMTNNSNINVDGDKITAIALLYDSKDKLIGAFSEDLNMLGKRVRNGDQLDFLIKSGLLSNDLTAKTTRIEVVAGCQTCN
ncbi:hypothetical protein [Brevibacillus porteri]|uniref:hypothetical protein n=1 Tax=Brevibacillus porteri TaxID=2126350 RepID=UPI003D258D5F